MLLALEWDFTRCLIGVGESNDGPSVRSISAMTAMIVVITEDRHIGTISSEANSIFACLADSVPSPHFTF